MHPVLSLALDEHPSATFNGMFADWRTSHLPLGDPQSLLVMCADGALVACRYMATSELLDSIRTGRLMPTVVQLRDRSPWSYLLLDGEMHANGAGKVVNNDYATGWEFKAIQGALLSVQEAGVGLVYLQSTAHLQDQVYLLAKRDRTTSRLRPPRDMLFVSPVEDMFLSFPGIGEHHLRDLLHFTNGNGAAALDALLDPDRPVPGIGPKIKANARAALGLSDSIRLALIDVTTEVPV